MYSVQCTLYVTDTHQVKFAEDFNFQTLPVMQKLARMLPTYVWSLQSTTVCTAYMYIHVLSNYLSTIIILISMHGYTELSSPHHIIAVHSKIYLRCKHCTTIGHFQYRNWKPMHHSKKWPLPQATLQLVYNIASKLKAGGETGSKRRTNKRLVK